MTRNNLNQLNIVICKPLKIVFYTLLVLTSACSSLSNNNNNVHRGNQLNTNLRHPRINSLNPIDENTIHYADFSKYFTYPGTAAQLRAGNGGDTTITDFTILLYQQFLNPLAAANPGLRILAEPKDLTTFFFQSGIETQKGFLQNHDGDTTSSNQNPLTSPSYPTTLAIIKLLNLLLPPLDSQPAFQQLIPLTSQGQLLPQSGFFAQFIQWILTFPTSSNRGWSPWEDHHGTGLNSGMFDFDAGWYFHLYLPPTAFRYDTTYSIGIDQKNQVIADLAMQINNFMYLLLTYFNLTALFIQNIINNFSDPTTAFNVLDNTVNSSFTTPNLSETMYNADKITLICNQSAVPVNIFTALPRFMINASYGRFNQNSSKASRDWGQHDSTYGLLLHFSGLSSCYFGGTHNRYDFVHAAGENPGHYYAYTDTTGTNSDLKQRQTIGLLVYSGAWNDEMRYILNNSPAVIDQFSLNKWYTVDATNQPVIHPPITINDLLITGIDTILFQQIAIFSAESVNHRLQRAFFPRLEEQTNIFNQIENQTVANYNNFHFGFIHDTDGSPATVKYVDVVSLDFFDSKTSEWYLYHSQIYFEQQKTFLVHYAKSLQALYAKIDLHYRHHKNQIALKYQLPNLETDSPSLHHQPDKWSLYNFYLPSSSSQYYQHFQSEQQAIAEEYHVPPKPSKDPIKYIPQWAVAITISVCAIALLSTIGWLYFHLRNKKAKPAQPTISNTN